MPTPVPCAIVIFGASGDLAQLKLIPAVYELCRERLVSDKFVLVGYARSKEKKDGTPLTDEQYRRDCYDAIRKNARHQPIDESVWKRMEPNIFYVSGAYDSADDHARLAARLKELDKSHDTAGNRLFYVSTPPEVFEGIITCLGQRLSNAENPPGFQRIIIEKPFGRDLKSAQHLNSVLLKYFQEKQIFRIDHYLGKETVQNLMVMRFANSIFEPIWNYKYIDHVQITVSETLSADDRAGYYDKSGATRDMIQNHMFQLMALVAMEPPAALDAVSIRDEKVKVYKSVRPVRPSLVDAQAVRGQYGPGQFKDKSGFKTTAGYLKARGVAPGSRTETFSAIKLFIDNWRWSGMPFYLRTGKCLPEKLSEIVVRFRSPPLTLFQKQCDRRLPQRPGHPRPARRRHQLASQRQSPRRRDGHQIRCSRFPLQNRLQDRSPRSLRTAPLRRVARRPNPVHPRRRGRSRLASDQTPSRKPGPPAKRLPSNTPPTPGARRPPWTSSNSTAAAGSTPAPTTIRSLPVRFEAYLSLFLSFPLALYPGRGTG